MEDVVRARGRRRLMELQETRATQEGDGDGSVGYLDDSAKSGNLNVLAAVSLHARTPREEIVLTEGLMGALDAELDEYEEIHHPHRAHTGGGTAGGAHHASGAHHSPGVVGEASNRGNRGALTSAVSGRHALPSHRPTARSMARGLGGGQGNSAHHSGSTGAPSQARSTLSAAVAAAAADQEELADTTDSHRPPVDPEAESWYQCAGCC